MKFLHPSYLHWLWLALIPILLWLFRRIQFIVEEYSALVILGSPNRAESWCWQSQSSENHLVKATIDQQTKVHETRIQDITGQAAPSTLELAASQFYPGLCADGQAARSSQELWRQLFKRAVTKGLILSAEHPSPVRSDTFEHEVRFDELTRMPVSGPNNTPAFRREDIIVWDAHPGNFVMTPDGVLVPIDLIITENRGINGA